MAHLIKPCTKEGICTFPKSDSFPFSPTPYRVGGKRRENWSAPEFPTSSRNGKAREINNYLSLVRSKTKRLCKNLSLERFNV
jgi:hypothetical protein